MKKAPRFFCDNCGYEVDNKAKACPHCGRFFSSVRCPSCGFSGADKLFQKGCPCCGYSAVSGSLKPQKRESARLPTWAFILSIIALLALLAVFSYYITR